MAHRSAQGRLGLECVGGVGSWLCEAWWCRCGMQLQRREGDGSGGRWEQPSGQSGSFAVATLDELWRQHGSVHYCRPRRRCWRIGSGGPPRACARAPRRFVISLAPQPHPNRTTTVQPRTRPPCRQSAQQCPRSPRSPRSAAATTMTTATTAPTAPTPARSAAESLAPRAHPLPHARPLQKATLAPRPRHPHDQHASWGPHRHLRLSTTARQARPRTTQTAATTTLGQPRPQPAPHTPKTHPARVDPPSAPSTRTRSLQTRRSARRETTG